MEVKEILKKQKFKFNKNLGQNFLTDGALLAGIAQDGAVSADDTIVEIGTGAGTLTRELSKRARRVLSFEVDERLRPILAETLQGLSNVEIYFSDVLKMSDEAIAELTGEDFSVVANLPYYVTTPMLLRFVCGKLRVKSVTVMVQKEVALRIAGDATKDSDYGSISALMALYGDAEITRQVPRTMFYPAPEVDSAVLRIVRHTKYTESERTAAAALIKKAFAMRRKTLYNNLRSTFGKYEISAAFEAMGLDADIRGERLSAADFVRLSSLLQTK